MIVAKYALAALLVVVGIVAYAKRDAVVDAYDWDPTIEQSTVPTFDPKAVADQHRLPVPENDIDVVIGPDTRRAVLPAVGPPTTAAAPVAMGGGKTTISGVVVGPGGAPLPGAVVRIERFVGEQSVGVDVTANGNGAFAVGDLLGGRYRLRSWLAPTYAQPGSEVTFIGNGEQRNFRLSLDAPADAELSASASASSVILGQSGSVSATLRNEGVTSEGKVAFRPWPGQQVTVSGGGIFTGFGASLSTDGSGTVTVPVACGAIGAGSFTFSAAGSGSTASITCAPIPTTTTTTAPPATVPVPAPGPAPAPAPVTPTAPA